jgi:hypothetical protein
LRPRPRPPWRPPYRGGAVGGGAVAMNITCWWSWDICGGKLFESSAVGGGRGSKFGGGRGKTLVIGPIDGGVGAVIVSGVAGGGCHGILKLVFRGHADFKVLICFGGLFEADPFSIRGGVFSGLENERFSGLEDLGRCDGDLSCGGKFLAILNLFK